MCEVLRGEALSGVALSLLLYLPKVREHHLANMQNEGWR